MPDDEQSHGGSSRDRMVIQTEEESGMVSPSVWAMMLFGMTPPKEKKGGKKKGAKKKGGKKKGAKKKGGKKKGTKKKGDKKKGGKKKGAKKKGGKKGSGKKKGRKKKGVEPDASEMEGVEDLADEMEDFSKGSPKKGKKKGKGKPKKGGFLDGVFGKKKPKKGKETKRGPRKKKKGEDDDEKKSGSERKRGDIKTHDSAKKKEKLDYASARFEELETYPIKEPFAYIRILYDKKAFTKVYHAVEPELTRKEDHAYKFICEVLKKALNIPVAELDVEPERYLKQATRDVNKSYNLGLKGRGLEKVFYYVERDLLGYGVIDVLMRDPNIEDISCDGPNIPIFIYDRRYESLETTLIWEDEEALDDYSIRLAQRCDKHLSIAQPILDSTLMDGSRAIMSLGREVTTRGSSFCIRKFREQPFTPTDLIDFNTISSVLVAWLWIAIQYGMSMLVCGGTASGKTTSLNALALFIHRDMKVFSIEETRELNLPHPNWVASLTRQGFGGAAEVGAVTMYDLLRAALRERPEYIVVGEIRGAEAYVLFQAMSTGHTTYSTIHADSVQALVHRLENKPIDIPRVMIPALDAVVIQIQTRIGERRVRRAKQVVEIIGLDPHTGELLTNEVFRWIPATDEFEFSGKSYILEKVMVRTNQSKPQMMEELKNRKKVLDWLVENDIRAHMDVAKVIMEYYLRPEDVIRQIVGEKEPAKPAMLGGSGPAPTLDSLANPSSSAMEAMGQGGPEGLQKEPCPSCGHGVRTDRPDCPKCGRKIR